MRRLARSVLLAGSLVLGPTTPLSAQIFDSQHLDTDTAAPAQGDGALFRQAEAAQRSGDTDGAIRLYTQFIQDRPNIAPAYINRGNAYNARKDFEHALADYNQGIALDASRAMYFNVRGVFYRQQKQCDLAVADFNRALALDSPLDRGVSHSGLALCFSDGKKYAQAVAEFTQAIALTGDPADHNLAIYYADRAQARRLLRDYAGAIADFNEALGRMPKNAAYALNVTWRGVMYRQDKDYQSAIADFSEAIGIEPSGGRYYERGLAYTLNKDDDDALTDYDQAIKLGSPRPAATALFYLARAHLYGRRKDLDHALADFSEGLKLAPDNAALLNGRCWVRALADRELDGALTDCEAALRLFPANADIIDSRGFAFFRKGDFDRAIADYDAALRLKPDFAVVIYHRGMAEKAEGDKTGADADIAHALSLDPHAGDDMKSYGLAP
jgi:tetratricopeptide (TPR) repeat protein